MLGEHSHGPDIVKEDIFNFRYSVKKRGRETHDNSHRIIAEAHGKLSQTAKTLLLHEKCMNKLCYIPRQASLANPRSLCDIVMDENFITLGGKSYINL